MLEFFNKLFDSSDWPPRWHCGRWTEFHGWLYIISDLLIWSAYFTIPLVIIKYISRKQDVRFIRLYFLFAAFILACGSTHLCDAMAFWVPIYRVNALVRAITGVLSWITVFYLVKFLPVAFSLKSQQQLETEVEQRKQAEEEVTLLNGQLEQRVLERTEALRRSEAELQQLNEELENRIALRTAELEEANKEMEAFTYSVSHDLRAPLRGILGFATILEEDYAPNLDEEARRVTAVIKGKTLKMSQLIDDLLEFSRIGRQHLSRTTIDTNAMVREVIEDLAPQNESNPIKWQVHVLAEVQGDINTIRQVWVNLISNAIKYSRRKERPAIEIGYFNQWGRTIFFIKDNGVGFDIRYRDKLFKVFQRLHSAEEFEGTGVGLALVSKILHKHGGTVWAEAEVDKGATFFFSVPDI